MSAILTHDCPHCGTRSVAMNYQGNTRIFGESEFRTGIGSHRVWCLLSCGRCRCGIMALFSYRGTVKEFDEVILKAEVQAFSGGFSDIGLSFMQLFPDFGAHSAPTGTPERAGNLFDQATNNLANQNWDASGAMSRKCLDVATKILAKDRLSEVDSMSVKKAWLKQRINLLCKAGVITSDIADLAMVIKEEGDDASHDEEEYTQEDATALIEFTKVFLTYVFTIPQMVASVKPAEITGKVKS